MRSLSSDNSSRSARRLFFAGSVLGAVCFLLVYGARILDPTYDDWLLLGDMDLRQHYIGFCHFRQSRWQFPPGLIETLSFPQSMSVVYTDSIPILAVFFKLFAFFLPLRFQYFGIAGLISFMLMGGFSCLLLARFTDSLTVILPCSLFFILSYPIIQRMYYHTALAAHWILILALVLWLYQEELTLRRRIIYWSLTGFLCVGIHSYFLPMTGLIMLAAVADEMLTGPLKGKDRLKRGALNGGLELIGFCLAAIISLFLYGAFYGGTSAVGEGLGTFSSNLNTFINPLSDGRLYGELPLYYDFQYEGFGYLGGGMIFLLIFVLVCLVICTAVSVGSGRDKLELKGIIREHVRLPIAAVLFACFCALAMFPIVSFNGVKLFGVWYPGFVRSFLGIFRSNGRFIWTAVYLLMLAGIVGSVRLCGFLAGPDGKRTLLYVILSFALALQLYDISGMLKGKHDYFAERQSYENIWLKEKPVGEPGGRYSGFVFLYNDNDILMDTAYYAYLNGMWQNNYYYARDINDITDLSISQWRAALKSGRVRSDIIYIFKEDDAGEELTKGLKTREFAGHIIGTEK